MSIEPQHVLQIAAATLEAEEFDSLVASVDETQRLGRLRHWQELLLARLPIPVGFEDFLAAFANADPLQEPTASQRAREFLSRPLVGIGLGLLLFALIMGYRYFGSDIFLSSAGRKARVEAAVVKTLNEEGPQRPLPAAVELQEINFGSWEGVAKIGQYRYRVSVTTTWGRVFVVYRPE